MLKERRLQRRAVVVKRNGLSRLFLALWSSAARINGPDVQKTFDFGFGF
jgi:hypothetical protein